jgi:hypothetical protein
VAPLINEDTKAIITKAKISEIERQRKTLDDKLQEVHDLKLCIQEAKLGEGVKPEEVRAWTDETKANDIVPIEEAISGLETVITTAKGKELRRKENLAAQVRDEEYQEKLKSVRLQKLEITKFDGTYKDWLRFWNQFEAEIQAADIPAL